MPDENITVEPHGTDVNIPSWLSPADQDALKHDLGLPKGSKEFKQAAKKWKKKTNDLKKAAKAAQDAAGKAAPADAAQAQGIADDATSRATDLEGTVLKGFGGTITITRITVAGVGVAIIVAVVVVLAGGGGGNKQNAVAPAGGEKKQQHQEKKAPKAPISWSSRVISTNSDASCHASTVVEYTVLDGGKSAGKPAVAKMTGTQNATQNATVGAEGTFQVTFTHTLQPAGPGTCKDTETYSLQSVGGDTNVASGPSTP